MVRVTPHALFFLISLPLFAQPKPGNYLLVDSAEIEAAKKKAQQYAWARAALDKLVAGGYALVRDTLSEADRSRIEKYLFVAAANVIREHRMAIHNIQCWKNSAVALAGYVAGDKELVREAIDGNTTPVASANDVYPGVQLKRSVRVARSAAKGAGGRQQRLSAHQGDRLRANQPALLGEVAGARSVLHRDQEQTLGRNRRPGFDALRGAEEVFDLRPAEVALAGFEERSHHVPHHVFQETAAADTVSEPVAGDFHAR
jgi:hypothetical protein